MKTRNIFALGAITIALLTGCKEAEKVEAVQHVRPAELYTVEDSTSTYLQNFPALVEASDESDLAFRVSGELEYLPVVSGSTVKKGDVLAHLDQKDFILKVEQAKANYTLALKTFERQKSMLKLELTSQAAYDAAFADMTLTKVALSNAKNNVSYTVIKAPFDGRVSKVNFENYEAIAANQPLLSFHAEDGLDISFELPESILSRATRTDAVDYQPIITFTGNDDIKNKQFKASFQEMDQEADPSSRSFEVILTMPKPAGLRIVPGMTANVQIELDKVLSDVEQYVLVPVESVFSPETTDPSKGKFAVWKLDADTMTVHQQMITVNGLTDKGMKVTSGLNKGDIVVAAGVSSLVENTKVRAWIRERGL